MIYFVRHGECVANKNGCFAGITDSPLTEAGKTQATQVGRELLSRGIRPHRIVSSSLPRAQQTALIIAGQLGYDADAIFTDTRFNEYDFGDLNGKPKEGVDSKHFMSTPKREDTNLFYERLREAWNEYCALEGDTLIVSHSFVRLGLECALGGEDMTHFHDKASHTDSHQHIATYDPRPI